MIRDLFNWVAPGLATVLAGTALCLALTSTNIANDVAAQGATAMQQAGYDWAELSFDMRDVTLAGTTTDEKLRDAALIRLAALPGIRSVTQDVTVAPIASPYTLVASIDETEISILGAVPDETTKRNLLSRAGLDESGLELRSGMPERNAWVAGAQYAVDQLHFFDDGTITLSDLTLDIEGRAGSERDYRDLLIVLRAGVPAGLALGKVAITPALVTPYTWAATFDGDRIDVVGYVPNASFADRYRAADVAGVPVATGLSLGSGEPADFADLSQTLLEQLARLEYGSATITGNESSLTGGPPSAEVAQAIVNELSASSSIIVLDPPRIEDYWVSATLQQGGVLVFDGYAPDAATRDALGKLTNADITWLKLGRGAPERYQSALDFGLAALARMSEGRFALRDNVVSLTGVARSGSDYQSLLTTLGQTAPQGLVLASPEILAPRAAQYVWVASKGDNGVVTLSGMVPNREAEALLIADVGESVVEAMTYASGEPSNFVASAQTGIDLLQWLSDGKVELSGSSWLVTGTPKSSIDKSAVEADFVSRKLASAGWSMSLAEPPPTIPLISPYLWSVSKSATGAIALDGHVPTQSLKSFLAVHAGALVSDATAIGDGAPDGFVGAATAVLDTVLGLEEGAAAFDGASWSLSGSAVDAARRDALLATLAAAVPTDGWTISIQAPEPRPVATTPYVWSASKTGSGAVTLSGLVAAEALKRLVAVRAGDLVTDQTTVDPTAPEGFVEDVLAAVDALSALSEGSVAFDGTTWSIEGSVPDAAASASIDAAIAAAATPPDAWQLALISPPPAPEPIAPEPVIAEPVTEPAPAVVSVDAIYAFSAIRSGSAAPIFSGQIPSDPALRYFTAITDGDGSAVTLAEGAPPSFLPSAELGLRALMQLQDAQLDFADGAWSLRGTAADAGMKDAVLASLAADPDGAWTSDIAIAAPPPAPVAVEPAVVPKPTAVVDIAACREPLADFSARNAILFQSGAAIIAAESDVALDELATDLAACPDAVVHIEGHTDADGDEQLNLALSVARAEAVVAALIERNVNPARLYAVGYGESMPIADNETTAGKRLNRRIVVTVSDEHF